MGYVDFLRALLEPLGVYKLTGGPGGAELTALGAALDGANRETETMERECTVRTAEGFGLTSYEKLLPSRIPGLTVSQRRMVIEALLSIDGTSFTLEKLNGTLAGCGIRAHVEETDRHYVVRVTFPGVNGYPYGIETICERIEAILPCHLNCEYAFTFGRWMDLEAYYKAWGEIDSGKAEERTTWQDLERIPPVDYAEEE